MDFARRRAGKTTTAGSIPHRLRFLLAFDHDLCLAVHRVYWRALRTFHRRRARELGRVPRAAEVEAGGFTVIQRFGSSCELNLHFHTPMLDGVHVRSARDTELGREPTFVCFPAPSPEEISALCDTIANRVRRLLIRRGHWEDDDEGGRPTALDAPPPMADLFAASIQHRRATGPSAGSDCATLLAAPSPAARRPEATASTCTPVAPSGESARTAGSSSAATCSVRRSLGIASTSRPKAASCWPSRPPGATARPTSS